MLDEIIVTLQQGARQLPQIKRSGTKATVKIIAPITTLLHSVRSTHIDPGKGTHNPPHIHQKVPPKLTR